MNGLVINIKDRLESIKIKKTSDSIKEIGLNLAKDANGYKSIIIIYEALDGEICASWSGLTTGGKIKKMLDCFLQKVARVINAGTKQKCSQCGEKLAYIPPQTAFYQEDWRCLSAPCLKKT